MKKHIALQPVAAPAGNFNLSFASLFHAFVERLTHLRPVVALTAVYSRLLEEDITPRQTLLLLQAQVAFFALAFPLAFSLALRLVFLLWFALSLVHCRRAGLGKR